MNEANVSANTVKNRTLDRAVLAAAAAFSIPFVARLFENIPPPPPPTVTLTANVFDSVTGLKLPGATCVFNGVSVISDGSGNAAFPNLPNGTTSTLTVSKTGYDNSSLPSFAVTQNITIPVPLNPIGSNNQGTLIETVTDSVTGTLLNGIRATLTDNTGHSQTKVTVNGVVSWSTLLFSAGPYALVLSDPLGQYLRVAKTITINQTTVNDSTKMVKQVAQTFQVNVILQDSVTHQVINADIDLDAREEVIHQANGVFIFTGVPAGTHAVIVTLPPGYASYSPTTLNVTKSTSIIVNLVKQVSTVAAVLVNVTDSATHQGILAAGVNIAGLSGNTDANGNVTIPLVPVGTQTVAVSRSGYVPQAVQKQITAPDTFVLIQLVKQPVTGPTLIVSQNGTPLESSQPLTVFNTSDNPVTYVVKMAVLGTSQILFSSSFTVAAHSPQTIDPHLNLPSIPDAVQVTLTDVFGTTLLSNTIAITV
jgi:hypothetical protein